MGRRYSRIGGNSVSPGVATVTKGHCSAGDLDPLSRLDEQALLQDLVGVATRGVDTDGPVHSCGQGGPIVVRGLAARDLRRI